MKATILVFFFMIGCSSLSDKKVYQDKVEFIGGRLEDRTWEESLKFRRVTWYSRALMEFDLFLAPIEPSSPFIGWLGQGEKKYSSICRTLYVSISNNRSSRVLSDGMYVDALKKHRVEEILAPNFLGHLKLHPDYVRWNMTTYKPRLFCSKGEAKDVTISFPSFESILIKL